MKEQKSAESLLKAYFREEIAAERAVRKQREPRLTLARVSPRAGAKAPEKNNGKRDAIRSLFLAAACLFALVGLTLTAPRQIYEIGAIQAAAEELKAQADSIGLFIPFVPSN